jgi:hypothetical protein
MMGGAFESLRLESTQRPHSHKSYFSFWGMGGGGGM